MAKADLTAALVRELLDYIPDTGILLNRTARRRAKIGCVAGGINSIGYRCVTLFEWPFLAHRLIWLYVHGRWPTGVIDHINGDRADNRLCNLREVTTSVNMQNQTKPTKSNTSGFLGVVELKNVPGKWGAFIKTNGKTKNLGSFKTPEDAYAAYLTAKRRLHEGCTI